MVAERRSALRKPPAMARSVLGSPRQKSLADELAEVEEEQKVSNALQAQAE